MFKYGVIAGVAGLCVIPALLGLLFRNKDLLATILSTAVATALFFYSLVFLPQIIGGVLLVYVGVIIVNIFTSGFLHERKGGGRDRRFSIENNPFIEGLFSGAVPRAIIAIAITFFYQLFTGGDLGPLRIIRDVFVSMFSPLEPLFRELFK